MHLIYLSIVHHKILFYKRLENIGIREPSQRKTIIIINNIVNNQNWHLSGVPQGILLGPVLVLKKKSIYRFQSIPGNISAFNYFSLEHFQKNLKIVKHCFGLASFG